MDLTPERSKNPELRAVAVDILAQIDQELETNDRERPARDYLGGSRLGVECDRQLGYEYTNTVKDPGRDFNAKTLRIFRFGDAIEVLMVNWLRSAGFDIITNKPNGGQIGFATAPHPETGAMRLRGHIDGVVIGGPEHVKMAYPALLEIKSMNDKNFKKVVEGGIKKTKPEYYAQVQVYMAYLELFENPCLHITMNKNDSEIHAELMPFDAGAAQEASDKGLRVIEARAAEELPRIATKSTDWRCRFCDYAERCWSTTAPHTAAPAPEKPVWLTGGPNPP